MRTLVRPLFFSQMMKKDGIFYLSDDALEEVCSICEISFNDISLLETALTHKSFSHETALGFPHSEKLEFLGDSVLGLVINEYIYKEYPNLNEGELAKMKGRLVSESVLAEISSSLQIGRFIQMGRGEDLNGGRARKALLEDTFEAIVGALYLDGGLEKAREFILRVFGTMFEKVEDKTIAVDYKTLLQERVQKKTRTTPDYKLSKEYGPAHDKSFIIEVYIEEKLYGKGEGENKKTAEQAAAKNALKKFR